MISGCIQLKFLNIALLWRRVEGNLNDFGCVRFLRSHASFHSCCLSNIKQKMLTSAMSSKANAYEEYPVGKSELTLECTNIFNKYLQNIYRMFVLSEVCYLFRCRKKEFYKFQTYQIIILDSIFFSLRAAKQIVSSPSIQVMLFFLIKDRYMLSRC